MRGLVSPQLQPLQLCRFLCNSVENVLALKLSKRCAEEAVVALKVAPMTQSLCRLEVHFSLPRYAPRPRLHVTSRFSKRRSGVKGFNVGFATDRRNPPSPIAL